jgi:hypothetical protein
LDQAPARGARPAVVAGMASLKYDYLCEFIGVNPEFADFANKKV